MSAPIHRGSSSTRNSNTIGRKSYLDAFLGIDPVVRNIQTSTISSISQVDTLFNGGQFEEALKGYEEILLLNPDDRDVHNKMSRCDVMLSLRELQNQDALPNNIKRLEDRLEKKLSENTKELEDHLDNSTHREEVDSFIATGTITRYSLAMKADRLLSLNRLGQAKETISKAHKLAPKLEPPFSLGMLWESYICIIHGKIELALGSYENAVKAARQAHILDPSNDKVTTILERVHMAKLARDEGDKMFHLRKYMEAYEKYMIGLEYAWPNVELLNKMAACQMRLNQWKRVIKFSNLVDKFYQNNLVDDNLFSSPFFELGKSDESVKENEEKASLAEDISDSKHKRGVEEFSSIEEYNVAISAPGLIIVFFTDPTNTECAEFTSFVESLRISFRLAKFLEVDINRCPLIAISENVQVVPAFKIYNRKKYAKLMIKPEQIYLKFWIQICTL